MKLTGMRGQILKQLALEGSLEESGLECSRHTKRAVRNDFVSHELMYVEKKEALGHGPGGRPRNIWSVKMNGVILALKNDLVTSSEVSSIVQKTFVSWVEKGLRVVKRPRAREAFRTMAKMFANCIGKDPEVCNLLKSFDFEFCPPVIALISLIQVAYLLQLHKLSDRQKKIIRKEIKIAMKELDGLLKFIQLEVSKSERKG